MSILSIAIGMAGLALLGMSVFAVPLVDSLSDTGRIRVRRRPFTSARNAYWYYVTVMTSMVVWIFATAIMVLAVTDFYPLLADPSLGPRIAGYFVTASVTVWIMFLVTLPILHYHRLEMVKQPSNHR